MWHDMSRALKESLSPYDNTPSDEIWDRSMIAKAIDAYEQMQNISSNELNVYVNNLANTLQIYVSRYRSELSEQMNSAEVAVKFGQLRMLFEDRGTLDIDYSRRDFMMYRMYRVQNERFQEYLNAFNANFEDMDTENDEGNEGGEDGENYENEIVNCLDDYTPIKTIKSFGLFPVTENIPWNVFLLESYAHNVSKKFYLSHARFL